MISLPEKVKEISDKGNKAVFEISPLYPGYGVTIGNIIRRVLLSSLPGAAITTVKITGVDHEFSAMEGVKEDVMQIIHNLKKIRFQVHSNEPVRLTLKKSGEGDITAADIEATSDVDVINKDQHIATVTEKKIKLEMEIEVENGIGYVPAEIKTKEKLPVGVIAVDAVFNPVKTAQFEVNNVRVGQRTDYNKVTLELETDGTLTPKEALVKASEIILSHFNAVKGLLTGEWEDSSAEGEPEETKENNNEE